MIINFNTEQCSINNLLVDTIYNYNELAIIAKTY